MRLFGFCGLCAGLPRNTRHENVTPPKLFGRVRFFPHHLDRLPSPLLIVSHSERAPFLAGPDVDLCYTRARLVSARPSFPAPRTPPPSRAAPRSCSTIPQLQSHASRSCPLSHPASCTSSTARTIPASIRPSSSALSVFISHQHNTARVSLSHRCPLCQPWLLMF